MKTNRKTLWAVLSGAIVIGVPIFLISQWAKPGTDEVVVVGPYSGPIQLVSRQQAQRKPVIDVTVFGNRLFYPARDVSEWKESFREDPTVSGLLFGTDSIRIHCPGYPVREDFESVKLEIEGQTFDAVDMIGWGYSTWNVPYAFGTSPKILRVRPNPEAPWLTLRIPPNGTVVKTPPDRVFTKGDLRIRLHYRPILLPNQAPVVEVHISGPGKNDLFAVSSSDFEETSFWSGSLLCDREPGLLHVQDWNARGVNLTVWPLSAQGVRLPFTRSDKGGNTGIKIFDPKNELLVEAIFMDSGYQSSGELFDASTFYVIMGLETAVTALRREFWTGPMSSRTAGIRELIKLRSGQPLPAIQYKKGKPIEIAIKFDLPPRELFDL